MGACYGVGCLWVVGVLLESEENSHLSTAVAWREKKFKHFVLGLLKSRISEKNNQPLLNKLDFKLFLYKARV